MASQLFLLGEETATQLQHEPPSEQVVLFLPYGELETPHPLHLGYTVAGVKSVRWPQCGLGRGRRGTRRDLQVFWNGRYWKGDVSGCWCLRGRRLRSRFQLLNLVKLHDERRSFIIFTGRPSVLEGLSDSNDLFNLPNVCVATVNVVSNSSDGGKEGLIGVGVVSEGDSCLCSSEWCTNSGTSTWNCWYGGCNVFLVRVIELTRGGLIGVWEVAVPDVDEGGGRRILYA